MTNKCTLELNVLSAFKLRLTNGSPICEKEGGSKMMKFTFEDDNSNEFNWIGNKDIFANKDFDDYRHFPNVMSFSREQEWTFKATPVACKAKYRVGSIIKLIDLTDLEPAS